MPPSVGLSRLRGWVVMTFVVEVGISPSLDHKNASSTARRKQRTRPLRAHSNTWRLAGSRSLNRWSGSTQRSFHYTRKKTITQSANARTRRCRIDGPGVAITQVAGRVMANCQRSGFARGSMHPNLRYLKYKIAEPDQVQACHKSLSLPAHRSMGTRLVRG